MIQQLGIDQLTRDERIELVLAIWDTIAGDESSPNLTESQRDELRRRVADDDTHPDNVVPWDRVKAETLKRLHS